MKAFGCNPHDLLIAKFSVYGFHGNTEKYIYTYLKNGKHRFHINNVRSYFKDNFGGLAGINS